MIDRSVQAWQRAINTLPKENLTPPKLKQKEQYEDGLKAALLAQSKADSRSRAFQIPNSSHKFPWTIAVEMRPELERARELMFSSSVSFKYLLVVVLFYFILVQQAWVILGAYEVRYVPFHDFSHLNLY
jgi:hypothetical protein